MSSSTTTRSPINTGAPSVCKNLEVDPRVKEAFELAFKALYPDGNVDFGPVPTSQAPLGQNVPSPAAPGSGGYTQTPTPGSTVGGDGKISDGSKKSGGPKETETTGEAK